MKSSPRRAPRLAIETLEDRRLLAAGVSPDLASLTPDAYRPDRILVQFQPGVAPQAQPGTTLGSALSLVPGLYEVELGPQTSVVSALRQYHANPLVTLVQPDYFVSVERLPNDPGFSSQWALNNPSNPDATIKATQAWDTTVGSGQTVVAIIDTGIDFNHPDLAANMWRNTAEIAGNKADDDGNGFVDDVHGYNFFYKNGNVMDDNGHGTHVAGIVGAAGNNAQGVTGVAWNVKLMALKFMNAQGLGATSDALKALNYAVQMGATISNNSWTTSWNDSVLEAGIRNAQAEGHIYVAAAGNTGTNMDVKKVYPAGFTPDNIVAVAALDSGNNMPGWSNWGPTTVDIAAPGSNIYSTVPAGKYGLLSGTSMAAPFVTGAIALVRDQHPTWTYRQVIDQVLSTADKLTTLAGKVVSGKLNLAAAVSDGQPPPPPPPQDAAGARVTGLASLLSNNQIIGMRVTFSEPMQTGSFSAADVLILAGPGGALAPTSIVPVAGSTTQFDVLFNGQSLTGNYSITLGTDILDVAGNALNQNANGINGENPADRYSGSVTYSNGNRYDAPGMPAPLRDRGIATYAMNIPDSMVIGAVRVQVNISHTWMSDLVVKLRSPAGTEILLANRRGGAGRGYLGTIFDDKASIYLYQGRAPFPGSYRPESPLAVLKGQNTNGTWTLIVEDRAGGDTGTINSWSLTIDQPAGGASISGGKTRPMSQVDVVRGLNARHASPVGTPQLLAKVNTPQAPLAPAESLTWEQHHRQEVIRKQAQQLLTAWQNSQSIRPLLQQVRQALLERLGTIG
jgi:serine protease